jgi:hypothetical protein
MLEQILRPAGLTYPVARRFAPVIFRLGRSVVA